MIVCTRTICLKNIIITLYIFVNFLNKCIVVRIYQLNRKPLLNLTAVVKPNDMAVSN